VKILEKNYKTQEVYIGLGTNLGNKENNLATAIKKISSIPDIKIIKTSSVTKTKPVDYLKQPDFLNQIILIETKIKPLDLLKKLNNIENIMGRKKTIPKGPRIIDLDILLYGNLVISNKRLQIPHKEILNRQFILKHLIELNRNLKNPINQKPYREAI